MSPSIWSACQVQLSSIGGAKSWTRKSLLTIWDLQYLNFVYVRTSVFLARPSCTQNTWSTSYIIYKEQRNWIFKLSFREGSKMSKRQNSISCRTFQGPFDLRTTMESGLQLWKLQISDFWGQRSWQLEVFLSWMYCAISQLKYVIHFRERVQNPQNFVEIIAKSHFYSPAKQSALLSARAFRERRTRKSRRQQSSEYFFWRVSFAHLVLSKSPKVKEEVSRKKVF